MPFDNLYHLNEDQIRSIYQPFARSFHEDDLYCALFQEDTKRAKFLQYFFQHYLKLIAPYCYFLADSRQCHSVMVVFDSEKESRFYMARSFWFTIKITYCVLRIGSFSGIRRLMALADMLTSHWVKDFVSKESYHMDLLYTKPKMRGQGLARSLIEALLHEANRQQRDVTMETHHKENVSLYEYVGFTCMGTMTHEDVTQYNLLYRWKEV